MCSISCFNRSDLNCFCHNILSTPSFSLMCQIESFLINLKEHSLLMSVVADQGAGAQGKIVLFVYVLMIAVGHLCSVMRLYIYIYIYTMYKRCEERPISIDILKGRWRLFGHILRLSDETPAVKAMKFYFEGSGKRFRGRPRETLVTTLNKDITRARSMERSFPIPTIKSKEDF